MTLVELQTLYMEIAAEARALRTDLTAIGHRAPVRTGPSRRAAPCPKGVFPLSTNPLDDPVLDLGRLQKGDRVGIHSRASRGHAGSYHTGTVERLTKTQVAVNAGTVAPNYRRFRLSDGCEVGVGYGAKLVHPDDPGLLAYAIRQAFDDVYYYAEKEHREARGQQPAIKVIDMARRLAALSEKTAQARAHVAALLARMPVRVPVLGISRLSCTDCKRETSNLIYQGRWCREMPDSNDGCPGFLLAVRAVPATPTQPLENT